MYVVCTVIQFFCGGKEVVRAGLMHMACMAIQLFRGIKRVTRAGLTYVRMIPQSFHVDG